MAANDSRGRQALLNWNADRIVSGIIALGLLILLVRVLFF